DFLQPRGSAAPRAQAAGGISGDADGIGPAADARRQRRRRRGAEGRARARHDDSGSGRADVRGQASAGRDRPDMSRTRATAAALAIMVSGALLRGQARPLVADVARAEYARLQLEIAAIRIFDHHAHPAWPDDPDVDAAPVPPGASPLRLRENNPEFAAAAKAFAGLKRERTAAFFNAVLDRIGIDVSMANRVMMADYLDPARFKWVFFVDCFMFPFDNTALAARNPDEAAYM